MPLAAVMGLQSGEFVQAAVERLQMVVLRGVRLAELLKTAGDHLLAFAAVLEEGQSQADAAIVADEEAHRELSRIENEVEQYRSMLYSGGVAGVLNGVWEAEISGLRTQARSVVEREHEARAVWSAARERVSEAADRARVGLAVLTEGRGSFFGLSGFGGVSGFALESLSGVGAAGAGVVAAGLMGRYVEGDLDAAQQAAVLAQLRDLLAEHEDDPAFFAGLMGDATRVDVFCSFVEQSAFADPETVSLGGGFASAAKIALPKWSGPLDAEGQREVGANLVRAVGEGSSGGRQLLFGYLFSGGVSGQVAYGAAVELDKWVSRGGQVWGRYPFAGSEAGKEAYMGAVGQVGVGGSGNRDGVNQLATPEVQKMLGIRWSDHTSDALVPHAVFHALSNDPKLSARFWAPTDTDLSQARVDRWLRAGDENWYAHSFLENDGGAAFFGSIAAATNYAAASGDTDLARSAALLINDVTHQLTDPDSQVGPHATRWWGQGSANLVLAYQPYVDGVGEALEGSSRFETGVDGLQIGRLEHGFTDESDFGIGAESMPGFERDEILAILESTEFDDEGVNSWERVLKRHMYDAGGFLESVSDQEARRSFLAYTSENAATVWGEIDHVAVNRAEADDLVLQAAASDAVSVVTTPLSVDGPPGMMLAIGIDHGTNLLTGELAHAEANKLAEIRSGYVNRSTSLIYEFQRGAAARGAGSAEMDMNQFLDDHVGYYPEAGLTPLEELIRTTRNRMVAARDD